MIRFWNVLNTFVDTRQFGFPIIQSYPIEMCLGNIQFVGVYIWIQFGATFWVKSLGFCCEISSLAVSVAKKTRHGSIGLWVEGLAHLHEKSPNYFANDVLVTLTILVTPHLEVYGYVTQTDCWPTKQSLRITHAAFCTSLEDGKLVIASSCPLFGTGNVLKDHLWSYNYREIGKKKLHRWVWFHDFTAVHAEF